MDSAAAAEAQEYRASVVRERDALIAKAMRLTSLLSDLPPGNRSTRRAAAVLAKRHYRAFQKRLGAALIRAFEALRVSGMGKV